MKDIYAVIIAGGQGTRFWPKSRQILPKQLLNILGKDSMIQETIARVKNLIPLSNILIVTDKQYSKNIRGHIPDIKPENIVEEPRGRNTVAAISLACVHLMQKSDNPTMVVLPSDHLIKKEKPFIDYLKEACYLSREKNCPVTLGIKTISPETGYGYIMKGDRVNGVRDGIYWVNRFIEKPDIKKAKEFLESDNYLWNSGIFIWQTEVFWRTLRELVPTQYELFNSLSSKIASPEYNKSLNDIYSQIESISVDNAIMEKLDKVLVIPINVGWSDVGSWAALYEILDHNREGNVTNARYLGIDTHNTFIDCVNRKKLIATIGIDDLIIVETDDVLLVCNRNRAQDIKKIVNELKDKGYDEYL